MSENKDATGPEYYKNYVIKCGLNGDRAYYFWFNDGTGFYGTPHEFGFYAERRLTARPGDSYELCEDVNELGELISYPAGPNHEPIEIGPPTHIEDTPAQHRGRKDPRF